MKLVTRGISNHNGSLYVSACIFLSTCWQWWDFQPSAEEVALDRWDVAVYYAVEASAGAGKTNAKHGAFLSNEEWQMAGRYIEYIHIYADNPM